MHVGGLDRDVGDEGRAGGALEAEGEGERVAGAEDVRAEEALVAVVEGDAGRAVHDVGQRSPQAVGLGGPQPEAGPLHVPLDESDAPGGGPGDPQPGEELCAPAGRVDDLEPGGSRDRGPVAVGEGTRPRRSGGSFAARTRISLPRKPVAPVRRIRRRERRPRAASASRASRPSAARRALASLGGRGAGSRKRKDWSRFPTPRSARVRRSMPRFRVSVPTAAASPSARRFTPRTPSSAIHSLPVTSTSAAGPELHGDVHGVVVAVCPHQQLVGVDGIRQLRAGDPIELSRCTATARCRRPASPAAPCSRAPRRDRHGHSTPALARSRGTSQSSRSGSSRASREGRGTRSDDQPSGRHPAPAHGPSPARWRR